MAYCLIIGKRKNFHVEAKPHNLLNVALGTSLLWFGWFGFNGGSAIASSPRAALAAFVTVVASATGGLFWCLIDFFGTRKWSLEKFCSGAVAGLVIITPASGYVAPWAALVMALIGVVAVRYCITLKHYFGFDDSLDAFGIHGIGGVIGNILTGVFADSRTGNFDGSIINGGWLSDNFIQIWYQIVGTLAISGYSFIVSSVILLILNRIPALKLRVSDYDEVEGLDNSCMGEKAYTVTVIGDEKGLKMEMHSNGLCSCSKIEPETSPTV